MENISNRDEIIILEKKREVLEETIRIALNIERLHHGLEATLAMEKDTVSIPQQVLDTLESLDEETRIMPSNTLKEVLRALEKIVQSKLDKILEISEMDVRQLLNTETDKIELLVNDYRKKAQTTIALRVLLHTRGEITRAVNLHVSADKIRARLSILKEKEKSYRDTIKAELKNMLIEMERMLSADNLAEKMKLFLTLSHQDLMTNLSHLDAGKSITAMPIAIEMIEMGEHKITSIDTTPAGDTANEQPVIQKQTVYSPAQTPTKPSPQEKGREKPGNLLSRLKKWAKTPEDENN